MSVRVCMHMGDGRQRDVNCEYLVVNFFLFFPLLAFYLGDTNCGSSPGL